MITTIKMIDENDYEKSYSMDALINKTCLITGSSYMAKMEGGGSSIIKFNSTIHNLYVHNNNNYDYIIQSKDSTINVEEKYSHHRPYNDNYTYTKHAYCNVNTLPNYPIYTSINEAKKKCETVSTCLCIDNFIMGHTDVPSYRLTNANNIDNSGAVEELEIEGYCSPTSCNPGVTCQSPCQAWVKKPSPARTKPL